MSYGVRSMLAFWMGGAALPGVAAATVTTTPFTGHAGLFLPRPNRFPKPRKWGKGFRKWSRR
jgi:hypothetical protein